MINFRNSSIVVGITISSMIYAQERLYFNDAWEKTTKEKMEYYREQEKKGNLTLIKDYYKNGVLQMEGLASDTTPSYEVFDGKVTWFYPSGKVQNFETYNKGSREGASQSFDENGRKIEDLLYKADETYSGRVYSYKNPIDEIYFNSISEYKDSEIVKVIVYDDDLKGIRSETHYKGYDATIDYYDEKGKLITTAKPSGSYENSGSVEYYYHPMRVAKVMKYDKDGNIAETIFYSRDKKILQEEKKNKKDGWQKTYNEKGVKIGELTYKYDEEYETVLPYSGDQYEYSYNLGYIESILRFKEGEELNRKEFNDQNILQKEVFSEEGVVTKINYFNEDGTSKGNLFLKDGAPYDGFYYEDLKEQKYADGVLEYSKLFNIEGGLVSEKKWNASKKQYETSNYDYNKKLTFTYTEKENAQDYFTANIVQYENGKIRSKATVVNSILTSGKLKFNTFEASKEIEKSGKWIILRDFDDEGKLISEKKILVETKDQYFESDFYIQEDQLLNYSTE